MTDVVIEPQPDGSVIVRGLSCDEVRAKLVPRLPGRPAGPAITRDEILAALAARRRWVDTPTQDELAADLGVSRFRLREAVAKTFGDWRQLTSITATDELGHSQS